MKLVSLFSCGGFGDFGFKKGGITPYIINDIDGRRLEFAEKNLAPVKTFVGDIRQVYKSIIDDINKNIIDEDFMLSMTPPCQGMSQNGILSIQKAVMLGKREKVDERNYLLLPCIKIIAQTKPAVVFFENVPQAKSTFLLIKGQKVTVTDYLESEMVALGYQTHIRTIDFSDYGVPQKRKRAIGIFTRTGINPLLLFPDKHLQKMTVKDALEGIPSLDAKITETASNYTFHPLHSVPVMRKVLYYWVAKTPEGKSAFTNNLCLSCNSQNELETLYCKHCGSILPKPSKQKNNKKVLIKGYDSSYRRLSWGQPANTVTTRSAFASSSYNLHPTENRVLSSYECALLQAIEPSEYNWYETKEKLYPDFLIREIIGEAVPPKFTFSVAKKITEFN